MQPNPLAPATLTVLGRRLTGCGHDRRSKRMLNSDEDSMTAEEDLRRNTMNLQKLQAR